MITLRKNLTQYLQRCNQMEMIAERIRVNIAHNSYFQIETVFERFDKFRKGYLIPEDLSEFMLDNGIYPTEAELYLIFRGFDQERVGVITISRFEEEILPKEDPSAKQQALGKKYYPSRSRLEIDLEFLIAKYFEHKIEESIQFSHLRALMIEQNVFSVADAFSLLDPKNKGTLGSKEDIDRFLRGNGKALRQDEVARIFRALNFDKTTPLTLNVFAQHFDPIGRGFYLNYAERVHEKESLHNSILEKKYVVEAQTLRNSREKISMLKDIEDLRESNRRISKIMLEQEVENSICNERLLSGQIRRNMW